MDLAEGHVSALQYVEAQPAGAHTYSVFNLGSGVGYSVLDMVEAMKVASGRPLPYEFAPRRAGDIAVCYADTKKASAVLGWTAKRTLTDMCRGKTKTERFLWGARCCHLHTSIDVSLAHFLLYNLTFLIFRTTDSWNWQSSNPNGYAK